MCVFCASDLLAAACGWKAGRPQTRHSFAVTRTPHPSRPPKRRCSSGCLCAAAPGNTGKGGQCGRNSCGSRNTVAMETARCSAVRTQGSSSPTCTRGPEAHAHQNHPVPSLPPQLSPAQPPRSPHCRCEGQGRRTRTPMVFSQSMTSGYRSI